MPRLTNKRTGELLRKAAGILFENGEGIHSREIFKKIEDTVELTDFEKGYYPSSNDSPRFAYLIRFASIGMVKGGWLEKNKGIWKLTTIGREAYNSIQDSEKFYLEANRLYKEWERNRPQEEAIEKIVDEETPISTTITFEESQEKAWDQVRDYLKTLNGYDFQDLVSDLLTAMGYHVNWVAPRGPDHGIDIIAYSDPLGTKIPRIKVQVKHTIEQTVSANDMRAFISVLGKDDIGIFVSSGGFTKDAEDEARTQESRKITLINLDKLFDFWVEYYDQLTYEARLRLPLKPIYYLAPEE